MSSWLNSSVRASDDSFRVLHARDAWKYHPFIQCPPYGDFTSGDHNPVRLVHAIEH